MPNTIDAMLRHLQRFVEFDLAGCVRWDQCSVIIHKVEPPAGKTKWDDIGCNVEIGFRCAGVYYRVRVESPELNASHPLGRVFFDDEDTGPVDERTWNEIAHEIKAAMIKIQLHNGSSVNAER